MMVQNFKDRLGLGARRFLRDQRGSTVVIFAVFLMAGVGFAAIAIDGGYLYSLKNKLQTTADAAVLVAVSRLPDTDAARAAAIVMAGENMPPGEHGAVLGQCRRGDGKLESRHADLYARGRPVQRSPGRYAALPSQRQRRGSLLRPHPGLQPSRCGDHGDRDVPVRRCMRRGARPLGIRCPDHQRQRGHHLGLRRLCEPPMTAALRKTQARASRQRL